ncbi:MAG TPA: hypothetical protein VM290_03805 [Gaiellaceae bacterium]|jgi:hypothetical protein|nr:hypothetical protein [Gaiellaceae bacterium]
MRSTSISRVEIEPARPEWKPFEEGSVQIALAAGREDEQRAYWEELLVAGAFRDRSAEANVPPVVAVEAGRFGSSRIGPGDGIRLDPAATGAPTVREGIADELAEAAAGHGAEIEEIEVLQPYGQAFAVTVRVDDPARFLLERFGEMLDGFFWDQELDGGYVLVRDAGGDFVLEAFYATRISAGGHRVRPDLEGCNPIPHSRPALSQPPPCPEP